MPSGQATSVIVPWALTQAEELFPNIHHTTAGNRFSSVGAVVVAVFVVVTGGSDCFSSQTFFKYTDSPLASIKKRDENQYTTYYI